MFLKYYNHNFSCLAYIIFFTIFTLNSINFWFRGTHLVKESIKAETKPKCCKCRGDHTANFRKSPVYKAENAGLVKSHQQTPTLTQQLKILPPLQTLQTKIELEKLSYATITNNETQLSNFTKPALIKILMDKIANVEKSENLKNTLITALNAMLLIITSIRHTSNLILKLSEDWSEMF